MNNLEFMKAIERNELSVIKKSLKKGFNPNFKIPPTFFTPLHYVVQEGYTYLAKLLLNNYANLNEIDANSWTALHYAVQNNHIKIVKLLLKYRSIDISIKDKKGCIALYYAIQYNYAEIVKLLFQEYNNILGEDKEIIALLLKAKSKNLI